MHVIHNTMGPAAHTHPPTSNQTELEIDLRLQSSVSTIIYIILKGKRTLQYAEMALYYKQAILFCCLACVCSICGSRIFLLLSLLRVSHRLGLASTGVFKLLSFAIRLRFFCILLPLCGFQGLQITFSIKINSIITM